MIEVTLKDGYFNALSLLRSNMDDIKKIDGIGSSKAGKVIEALIGVGLWQYQGGLDKILNEQSPFSMNDLYNLKRVVNGNRQTDIVDELSRALEDGSKSCEEFLAIKPTGY